LSAWNKLITKPRNLRPLGALIWGPSGNGKSSLITEFCKRHPSYSIPEAEIKPVLVVESPAAAGEKRLLGAILQALGCQDWNKGDTEMRQHRVLHLLPACRTQALILDEVHNLLIGIKKLEESLNVLKYMSNKLGITLLLSGTERARDVLVKDQQLSSRFLSYELPRWSYDREYLEFLKLLESTIAIRNPSDLSNADIAKTLLKLSNGILGNIVLFVKEAAVAAIEDGTERITKDKLILVSERYEWSSNKF